MASDCTSNHFPAGSKKLPLMAILLCPMFLAGCGQKEATKEGSHKVDVKDDAHGETVDGKPFVRFTQSRMVVDFNKLAPGTERGEAKFRVMVGGHPRPTSVRLTVFDNDGDAGEASGTFMFNEMEEQPIHLDHGTEVDVPASGPLILSCTIKRSVTVDYVYTVWAIIESDNATISDTLTIDVPKVIIGPAPGD